MIADFYTMSNLFPKHTGLPFVVWISERANARHDVRVKVAPGPKAQPDELVSVALRPELRVIGGRGELKPRDLALLKKWVDLNFETILAYWNREIDTIDAAKKLRKI